MLIVGKRRHVRLFYYLVILTYQCSVDYWSSIDWANSNKKIVQHKLYCLHFYVIPFMSQ